MGSLCGRLHTFHSAGCYEDNASESIVCIPSKKKKTNKTDIVVMETSRLEKKAPWHLCLINLPYSFMPITVTQWQGHLPFFYES